MRTPGNTHCPIISPIPDRWKGIRFMNPRTAKPSELTMRFFTPELYVRFNSSNEDEADQANEAWESALVGYRKHLEEIRGQMPPQVRKLTELCLHDAEFIGLDQAVDPQLPPPHEPAAQPNWTATALVSVSQDGKMISLIYLLWDHIREHSSSQSWPFSKARPHWLYDEVDIAPGRQGMFLHRVMLSDGRILEIPFVSAIIHSLPFSAPSKSKGIRQSA
jgi:hypothetical protein